MPLATQIWVMPVQVLLAAERASCRVLKAVAQLLPIPLAATAWLTYTLGATTGGELMAKAALDALMMSGSVARILNLYPLPLGTGGMLPIKLADSAVLLNANCMGYPAALKSPEASLSSNIKELVEMKLQLTVKGTVIGAPTQ